MSGKNSKRVKECGEWCLISNTEHRMLNNEVGGKSTFDIQNS